MAYQLRCPCGQILAAREDDFVGRVNAHLAEAHDGRSYGANEIMMMALQVPDSSIEETD